MTHDAPCKIYFKGAGLVTAIGNTIDEVLAVAANNHNQPSLKAVDQTSATHHIPYYTISQPDLSADEDRLYQIIDRVVQQAIDDAQLSEQQLQHIGLFVGSTSFDIFKCEMAIKDSGRNDADIATFIPTFNRLTHYIQDRFAIEGPVYTFNTACTSSANALIYASEFIRRGDISHALVLGLEFYNEVTALGFSGLELISQRGMSPFDKNRDGLYLGEGCGALIISAEPENNGFAYLAGANLGDTFSITACDPEGSTIQTVIERALTQANINKSDIAIIKTHGTASLSNDEAESAGLQKVFTETIPPIVALKPLIGHTLGACGINELIVFYRSLQNNSLITYPCQISDEFSLRLADKTDIPEHGYYLLNYFGFGGNSTALVITNA